ncbi:hypothetical protein R1flu_007597 [Riccia fluitans]|uniref:Uncharacterized protein n=1 Tax=Riccia fluitans TaxID=41844 RepID=A0ABD1YZJ5_9MARC
MRTWFLYVDRGFLLVKQQQRRLAAERRIAEDIMLESGKVIFEWRNRSLTRQDNVANSSSPPVLSDHKRLQQ